MPQRPTVTVGIAVVENGGCYLVGVRGAESPLAGKAEFPGGKCRAGEAARDCAVRECREETGLTVVPEERLLNRLFDYDHARVDLHFWRCRPLDPSAVAEEHQGFRWIPADELPALDFPEANAPLIAMLG